MFKIEALSNNEIKISGRFTAADVNAAEPVFNEFSTTTIVDFGELDYISSAGLSVLLKTQKRLMESEAELKLVKMNKMVREIFHYVGFETIFSIE